MAVSKPKASSKWLISRAVAVVELKSLEGCMVITLLSSKVLNEGAWGSYCQPTSVTHEQNQILIEIVNRHMPATPRLPHQKRLPAASGPIERDWPEGGSRQFSWVKHLPPAFLIRLQSPLASSGDSGPTCAA